MEESILLSMANSSVDNWTWAIWAMIGLVGAIFSDHIFRGRRIMVLDIILGVGGAMLGGYASVKAIGDDSPQLFILSVLVAVFVAWLLLWIAGMIVSRICVKNKDDD